MKTTKIEQLQAAILNLEEIKSDTYSMAVEFDQAKINSGLSYVSITVDPTGSWSVGSSPSWECSANEYFSESGVLSIATIYSASGCFGTPGPNDGYEWEDGDDYFGNDSGTWFTIDAAAIKLSEMDDFDGDVDDLAEEQIETELIARGFFKFSVSDRACEPDIYNNIADELETKIDELIASIQSEVDELEASLPLFPQHHLPETEDE